jgi:hypothetical protein
MKAVLLSLSACAALAGCVGYGGVGYATPGYGYYEAPGYYGGATLGYGGVIGPVYRDDMRGRRGNGDRDGDGIPNRMDRDRDNDGIPNRMDRDRDGDGVRNRADSRPNNPRRN